MEKLILKYKFLKLLKKNPKIVSTLRNPDAKFLMQCISESYGCREYFPTSFFTEKLLQEVLTTRNSSLLKKFPKKILSEITEDQAKQFFIGNFDIELMAMVTNTHLTNHISK